MYYIYVLENEDKRIKIGITQNFEQRLKSLQGSNTGGSLITRHYQSEETNLYTLERIMHQKFSKYRIQGTEWFTGVTFEEVVEALKALMSTKSYYRCNEERAKFNQLTKERK